ncbi:hypothetical protein XELAEV_18029527mg [Xenopus laevis]|uniref:SGNH hydrolase-type esterase domain-containing protein n=1 Tax=Xenopus laevis TaxID=8355 RepID=A0A974CRU7_XENLA|nr:hypothetical protein XELAEV_18029527mg [Xenopus laevis]
MAQDTGSMVLEGLSLALASHDGERIRRELLSLLGPSQGTAAPVAAEQQRPQRRARAPDRLSPEGMSGQRRRSTSPVAGPSGGCLQVWILGHSFVRWAEKRAAVRLWGRQLGCPDRLVEVKWFGFPGLLWPGVFDKVVSLSMSEPHPHVLVLHVGGNDMGIMSQRDLVRQMKIDIDKLRSLFVGVVIVWSEMIPRLVWRWAREHSAMERSRRKLNQLLSVFIRRSGGVVVRHKDLERAVPGHYRRDGVHLSNVGLDLFNLGLGDGVERAAFLVSGVARPA